MKDYIDIRNARPGGQIVAIASRFIPLCLVLLLLVPYLLKVDPATTLFMKLVKIVILLYLFVL